jgi:DNA-binding response OmpR family regulator
MTVQDHVLIVDDDAEIRSLLGEYFEKNGYRASVAADGKGLWAALSGGHPDLIVLDLMLPGDDGFTLCRELRARSAIPIIMLTARGEETDRIVGLELGADDYVPKPFNPRELLARVKSVLRRVRALPENLKPEEASGFRGLDARRHHPGSYLPERDRRSAQRNRIPAPADFPEPSEPGAHAGPAHRSHAVARRRAVRPGDRRPGEPPAASTG